MTPHRPFSGKHSAALPAGAHRSRFAGLSRRSAIALLCLLAIAGLWLTTLQRIAFQREQAEAAAIDANANLSIAFERQVFRTLKAAEQVSVFVREQYLRHGAGIDLGRWIEQGVIRETMFTIISIVDENGEVVSSSLPVGAVNYADREFFIAQREATDDALFISPPVLGRVSGQWRIPMSLRITRADGSFGGVVVISVDPDSITGFHRLVRLGDRGLLEVTGLDGIVRGRRIGNENSFGLAAGELPWFQRRAQARDGSLIDDGTAIDGVARIVSYRSVADYPLMVAVGTAYDDDLATVMQRRSSYLMMASGATAVLIVLSVLLAMALARQRSASEALAASEALFRATFHQAATGIAHIAPDGRILGANEKFCRMLGHDEDELRARTVFDLCEASCREEAQRFFTQRLSAAASDASALSPEIEKTYRRKDGSTLWVCEALGVVNDAHGQPDFLVAVTQDISARKTLEARLSHDALHDPLTGLANRALFENRLGKMLESARRHGHVVAVLYIDLDGFKAVNDSGGHAAGDALLQQVARRLEGCVRAEDTVSRFGGDEFCIALTTLARQADCVPVAEKIVRALAEPFDYDGGPVRISASVGVARFPGDGEDGVALVASADAAMYAAKNAGKNRVCLSTPVGAA
ncbi:MAG: diguanylate cyclase [Azospira sp.]|jgi:diguanylate cyclase (GGDEF)-like protein/PAS domain S-box-containing protein|nr:diguanylate cyclase [Azospira sp.]